MKKRWLPVCTGCLRRMVVSPRFIVVLVIMALYLDHTLAPVRSAMNTFGTRIGFMGMQAFLMNDVNVTACMALMCLALMFDLPATDELQRYLMLRTGRRSWAKGQITCCAATVIIFMLLFFLFSIVMALPCISFTARWSDGIDMLMDYETDVLFDIDIWLPRAYGAVAAFGWETLLHFLFLLMLGMLLMNVNLLVDRRLGFFAVALPIGLDMLREEYFSEIADYISPMTLCRLSGLDYGDNMGRPTLLFAIAVLVVLSVLLTLLFRRGVRVREVRF